jgi:hypothetical protein
MTVLVRTVVGESKADLEAKVAAARAEGWVSIGEPTHLIQRAIPAEGPTSWMQSMKREL